MGRDDRRWSNGVNTRLGSSAQEDNRDGRRKFSNRSSRPTFERLPMNQSIAQPLPPGLGVISFVADRVDARVEDFTEDFRVYGVYFQAGDPEADGHSWNFTRSFEDDDAVCTVREIQRATLYDRIQEFRLSRAQLLCTFEPGAWKAAGCARLEIRFDIDDSAWKTVAEVMDKVCSGKAFYSCT